MNRPGSQSLARAVFALLVLATVGAFFVTQRLKHSPTIVQQVHAYPYFSPYARGPGRGFARLSFRIKRTDEVTVTIVGPNDDDVATLARDHHLAAYTQWSLDWDGRTDAGTIAAAGIYRIRVRLLDQGRAAVLDRTITLDAAPPHPRITGIVDPAAPAAAAPPLGPAILPLPRGGPLKISFDLDGGIRPSLAIYRTDVARPRLVTTLPIAPGATSASWDGTAGGRSVGPGTYLVAVAAADPAGNVGQTPTLPPAPRPGEVIPGHPGITVRYLGVQPPVEAVGQGAPLVFGVDARRAGYAWTVTRVGAERPRKQATGAHPLLRMRPPGGISGVYVLGVRTRTRRTAVPFAVQAPGSQAVLVVLPTITWLGGDPLDDDGDGLPNTLTAGDAVRTDRIFAGGGLPSGFSDGIAPIMAFLDRRHLRYDVTTDLALAAGRGSGLRGHSGVLLVGDERWLPAAVLAQLRAFVRAGGKLASLGVDSLRRTVKLADGVLHDPSAASAADAFGARLAGVAASPGPITNYLDRIGLFSGGGGQFAGYRLYEATQSVGPGAELVASGVTGDGRPVIVAVRFGRGLVVRTGLPEIGAHLAADATTAALVGRIWALLSR
ncbi:MAG: N,N-dimethylformamidase beta subunit family domain-containing protein [Solirubrobacteraceae bacterium]